MDLFSIFILGCLGGLLLVYLVFSKFRKEIKKADDDVQSNPDKYLDEVFDGRKTAVYKVVNFGGTLRDEQVIEGAEERGYELLSQNTDSSFQKTLAFKKTD